MGNEAGALMHKCRYKVFLITHVWHPLQNRSSFPDWSSHKEAGRKSHFRSCHLSESPPQMRRPVHPYNRESDNTTGYFFLYIIRYQALTAALTTPAVRTVHCQATLLQQEEPADKCRPSLFTEQYIGMSGVIPTWMPHVPEHHCPVGLFHPRYLRQYPTSRR